MHDEIRLLATGGAQRVVSGGEEHAPDTASGVGGMDEEEEHLAVPRMDGGVADDAICLVDGDEQHVRRLVIGNELLPVLGREHRLDDEIAEEGPTSTDGGDEDRSYGPSIASDGGTQRDSH